MFKEEHQESDKSGLLDAPLFHDPHGWYLSNSSVQNSCLDIKSCNRR